jgi:putative transcriptional regulator
MEGPPETRQSPLERRTKRRTSLVKKKTTSGASRKNLRALEKPEGRTRLGRVLIAGANEMLARARGEISLESYTLPGPIDVKAIRRKIGMSQAKFAAAFALYPRTLQEWEQGKSGPDRAVRAYLTVIDRNPSAVVAALRS